MISFNVVMAIGLAGSLATGGGGPSSATSRHWSKFSPPGPQSETIYRPECRIEEGHGAPCFVRQEIE